VSSMARSVSVTLYKAGFERGASFSERAANRVVLERQAFYVSRSPQDVDRRIDEHDCGG
jgi:hypothetical protein